MRWPTDDWRDAGGVYKTLKYLATRPVKAVCRVHARGLEHVPREGPLLIAVNHWSWWDPILVADVVPRPLLHLAKSEVFRTRPGRWFFTSAGGIPVDRARGGNEEAMRAALDALAAGRVVAVYPEGTRSLPPALLPGRTGIARLALLTGTPIVPVASLSDRFWPMTRRFPKLGERAYVHIGAPIPVARDPVAAEDRAATRKLTDETMERIRRLLEEAAAARDRNEDWPWSPQNGRLLARG